MVILIKLASFRYVGPLFARAMLCIVTLLLRFEPLSEDKYIKIIISTYTGCLSVVIVF